MGDGKSGGSNIMDEIINWCNSNEGFVTALLSILTLATSIIAIIVSICTARLPYKKKLLLKFGSFIGVGLIKELQGIHITITNIGNRDINIADLGILISKQVYDRIENKEENRIKLISGESKTVYYTIDEIKDATKNVDSSKRMYAYVLDTEDKKYKKYIGRLKKILK